MIREESAFLLFLFGISFTTNVALVVSWVRSNRRLKQLENRVLGPPKSDDDRRIERIEAAVDNLAGQVDQIASGQEFLNRVIQERRPGSAGRALSGRVPDSTPV